MLKGKRVVVTGGAKGIGRYIAHGFARHGASVGILDIDEARLQQTLEELHDFGGKVSGAGADMRDESQVQAGIAHAAQELGGIDILVNNAAIVPHFQWGGPRWPSIKDMPSDFFWSVVGTNLGGTFLGSKHVTPYLEESGGGNIVNLYGGGAKSPAGALAYALSKEAIVHFTDYHAAEVEDSGICVVAISPGAAIATEDAPEEARSRMPGPDFAGDRFFLAAEAPMEMSGHLLDIDEAGKLFIVERIP